MATMHDSVTSVTHCHFLLWCYGLHVYISPKIYLLKPNPQGILLEWRAFGGGRLGLDEITRVDRGPMMGLVSL